jgi:hypothetical protein
MWNKHLEIAWQSSVLPPRVIVPSGSVFFKATVRQDLSTKLVKVEVLARFVPCEEVHKALGHFRPLPHDCLDRWWSA